MGEVEPTPWHALHAPLGAACGIRRTEPPLRTSGVAGNSMGVVVKKLPAALLVSFTPPITTATAGAAAPASENTVPAALKM
jgi:hypothetical protein